MDVKDLADLLQNFGFPVVVTAAILWGVWKVMSRVGEAVIASLERQAAASEKSSEAVQSLALQMVNIQSVAGDTLDRVEELAVIASGKRKALRLIIRAGDSLAETAGNQDAKRLLTDAAECLE